MESCVSNHSGVSLGVWETREVSIVNQARKFIRRDIGRTIDRRP